MIIIVFIPPESGTSERDVLFNENRFNTKLRA